MGQELEARRAQCRAAPAVPGQLERRSRSAEPLHHVAAVRQPQREEASVPAPADREALRLEASDNDARDVDDDDDADAHENSQPALARLARAEEDECRMVAR
jgi:hypothetical protein